ncbi:MAG: hypothetical protein WAN72_00055, partial [Candidatus Acidiferrales bacterium]
VALLAAKEAMPARIRAVWPSTGMFSLNFIHTLFRFRLIEVPDFRSQTNSHAVQHFGRASVRGG